MGGYSEFCEERNREQWRQWATDLGVSVDEDATDVEIRDSVAKSFKRFRFGCKQWREWAFGFLGKDDGGQNPAVIREELGNYIARGSWTLKEIEDKS